MSSGEALTEMLNALEAHLDSLYEEKRGLCAQRFSHVRHDGRRGTRSAKIRGARREPRDRTVRALVTGLFADP